MTLPRGIRNRNPGNIERSWQFEWYGEIRPPQDDPKYDPRFCVFEEPVWGIRAMMKNLITYNQRRGIKTLREAIDRWAPPHENKTNRYAEFVADHADIRLDDEWDFTQRIFLVPAAKAITLYENGYPSKAQTESGIFEYWYSDKTYDEAYELAVKGRITSHTMNELPVKPEVFTTPTPPSFLERVFQFLTNLFKGEK